jgi:hypothetical protein
VLIFGGSVNCIPWACVPEIISLHARAKGTAVSISSNWLWNFAIVMVTSVIINRLQWKAYLIFMCANLAFVPLAYFCYPETVNLTLEEIGYLFTNPDKGAAKLSRELHKERERGTRQQSFVQMSASHRANSTGGRTVPSSTDKMDSAVGAVEQYEKA